jgi:hypothetical protein
MLDNSTWVGNVHVGFSLMNPNPSHDDRFRLEDEDETLAFGVRDAPADSESGTPSSHNSTSPTAASDIRIIPAFFSSSRNKLSWFENRMLVVAEDTLR